MRISPYFDEIKARALQLLTDFRPTATTIVGIKGELRRAVREAVRQARDEMYARERPCGMLARAERAAAYRRTHFNLGNFEQAERQVRQLIWTRLRH